MSNIYSLIARLQVAYSSLMCIITLIITGLDLERERLKTVYSVDELVGGGSTFSLQHATVSPHMELFSGVRKGLRDEIHRLFEDVMWGFTITLYEKLKLRASGSDDALIYHATPREHNQPWYDNVIYRCGGDGVDSDADDDDEDVFYCAGRLMVFVKLTHPEQSPKYMALVHAYRCVNLGEEGFIYDIASPEALATDYLPLIRMKPAYLRGGKPLLELVDTETISSACWVQQDYDLRDRYWFFRKVPMVAEAAE